MCVIIYKTGNAAVTTARRCIVYMYRERWKTRADAAAAGKGVATGRGEGRGGEGEEENKKTVTMVEWVCERARGEVGKPEG